MSEATQPVRSGPDIFIPQSQTHVDIGPVQIRPDPYSEPNVIGEDAPPDVRAFHATRALEAFDKSLPRPGSELDGLRPFFQAAATGRSLPVNGTMFDPKQAIGYRDTEGNEYPGQLMKAALPANAYAREWRDRARALQSGTRQDYIDLREAAAKGDILAKAVLDVGTQTNFTQITGGQSLGYVSLDTRVARATVRPDSFTLYQTLGKSAAYQVVDYWPYLDDPGGSLPGSATSGFSNVASGTLATNAGFYSLQSVNLKLMLDGRAMTIALAAQNNFVSITEQENANAALTVLQTADWLCYHGNSSMYVNQFSGLDATTPTANIFDFQQFFQTNAAVQGWSTSQTLYNMIYEVAAVITSWGRFGRTTHAFMTPTTAGALQSLVTTVLNNLVNARESVIAPGIVVDGDLQGMRTRFGPIAFPMDLMITARDIPAQGQPRANGTTPTTSVGPTPPTGVTATASGAAFAGSNWGVGANSPYTSGTARYWYAVSSTDVNMNESTLTWVGSAFSGITATGAVNVAIAGPAAADATNFRVYRSGSGAFASGANSPTAVRYIGSVAASGTGTVTFVDSNASIPGGERIYLANLRAEDLALDFRYLLPITRVELFAQNLYAPWAVCMIGALRNRIPRFHGIITNFVPDNPLWNPLGSNA
jgi:hypothetical protein